MLASKTYIGERLDLEHYKGYSIIDYMVTITDDDDAAYPLQDFASIHFDLFAKQYGKLLDSVDVAVPSDNILILDVTDTVMDKRKSLYYHECYGMTDESPSVKVLLFHGVSEI
jgi:hypothetical protein